LAKIALLVIDMLNDFVKGKLRIAKAMEILPNVKELVEKARRGNIPVIYVNDAHTPGVDEEFKLWGEHAVKGTPGAEVVEELKPGKSDYVVEKKRYSGFFQTHLDLLLRELKVDTLILTGVATDICVLHTAADAFFRGYKVIVVRDATATLTEEEHKKALKYMEKVYGAKVISTKDALKILEEPNENL